MRRDHGMTPQMIFEHVNRTFGEAVYVTDVGQHQMWATQYLELDSWHQLITSGGLGTMGFGLPGGNRCKDRQSGQGSGLLFRGRRSADEHSGDGDGGRAGGAGHHLRV